MKSDMINLNSVAADSTTHHACQSDLALLMKGVWPLKKKKQNKKIKSILATGSSPIYFLLSWF